MFSLFLWGRAQVAQNKFICLQLARVCELKTIQAWQIWELKIAQVVQSKFICFRLASFMQAGKNRLVGWLQMWALKKAQIWELKIAQVAQSKFICFRLASFMQAGKNRLVGWPQMWALKKAQIWELKIAQVMQVVQNKICRLRNGQFCIIFLNIFFIRGLNA